MAQRLKDMNYAGNALFINSIASSAQQRSRTKPRSNSSPNIKAKQKASQENTSFPDDGIYIWGCWMEEEWYLIISMALDSRCLAYWEAITSYHHSVKDR